MKTYLQAEGISNACSIHPLSVHEKAVAAGSDALAAQLRQRISSALAHAHVVGRDECSQALQARGAAGRSSWGRVAGSRGRGRGWAGWLRGRWPAGGASLHGNREGRKNNLRETDVHTIR